MSEFATTLLQQYLINNGFAYLLVFTRVGAAFFVLPGFSSNYVNARVRLVIALGVSLAVATPLLGDLPTIPDSASEMIGLIFLEAMIGVFLGMLPRIMLSALDVAGVVIASHMSLANAMMFNPAMASQGTIVSMLFGTLGLTLIFVTNLHHLLIMSLAESYSLFMPGKMPDTGDMSNMVVRYVSESFRIGVQMSAPFMVVGLVFYMGMGMLARLMPQMQIFFVAMPLQIGVGLIILILTISTSLMFWVSQFEQGTMILLGQ